MDYRAELIVLATHRVPRLHSFSASTADAVLRRAPCAVISLGAQDIPRSSPRLREVKRIVVPTDFSDFSTNAFPTAAALAAKWNASMQLVHVVAPELPTNLKHLEWAAEENRRQEKARALLPLFLRRHFPLGVNVNGIVTSGTPVKLICQTAQVENTALIVIASHGCQGFKHFLLGSVTQGVLRQAVCSVLVVRQRSLGRAATEGPEQVVDAE